MARLPFKKGKLWSYMLQVHELNLVEMIARWTTTFKNRFHKLYLKCTQRRKNLKEFTSYPLIDFCAEFPSLLMVVLKWMNDWCALK